VTTSTERTRLVLDLLILGACCYFLFFWGAGTFGLLGADEPRYAQIAREMNERHDWVTPRLNGTAWLEKPVLYYWRASVAFRMFGVNEFAARFPSATFAALVALAAYFFMRRFRSGSEMDAALITSASAAMIGFAHGASTDMQLAAPFTVAMLCWFAWYRTQRSWLLALFYFFMAVGTLAKGPVAPGLAAVIILTFGVARRDWKAAIRTLWIPGIMLFLLIALPWFVLVQLQNPQFFRVFIIEHNLARFSTDMYRHVQPFWYYVPVMLLSTMPWTLIFIAAVVEGVRRWKHSCAEAIADDDGLTEFLLLWIVIVVLFFSISRSKLPGYILPAAPPCMILLADFLQRKLTVNERHGIGWWLLIAMHAIVCGGLLGELLIAPYQIQRVPYPPDVFIKAGLIGAGTFAFVLLMVLVRGLAMLRTATLAVTIVAVGLIIKSVMPSVDAKDSSRSLGELVAGVNPNASVAVVNARREVEYGLNFYLNRPIANYKRGEIPAGEHLAVAVADSEPSWRGQLGNRQVSRVGFDRRQKLELYWIGP